MSNESLPILFIAAYLIGSIPFGLLLTKAAGMGDIRQVGSGNIGATNVLRAGGKKIALLTLLLDAGKGAIAVLIASHYIPNTHDLVLVGLAAMIGHCYPVWLKFKGGKGVATVFGVMFALSFALGAICGAVWLLVFAITRYSSLAALISIALMPFVAQMLSITSGAQHSLLFGLIALLVIWRHRSNIKSLQAGTEHKFGKSKSDKEEPQDDASAA